MNEGRALERIFVSVASYRDSECPWTLQDLFSQARHPERVFAGVLWQYSSEDDPAWMEVPCWSEHVRGDQVDVADCKGVCWARHRIQQKFWQGEEYFFQIDSHSRFDPGWDDTLIAMLQRCPSPKPVLSTHPNTYVPPDQRVAGGTPILLANRFNEEGILMPKGKMLGFAKPPRPPLPGAFIGAGFVFAPSSVITEVPYDPFLYFQGEEITMAVRLWTHGYDIFSPNDVVVYHDYANNRGRKRHWNDHADWHDNLNKLSYARVRHLLGIEPATDPVVLQGLDRYGLGTARTLQEYEAFADISFQERRMGVRASDGLFPWPRDHSPAQVSLRRCFAHIYLNNGWKATDTRSGSGSSFQMTVALRELLGQVFQTYGIRILVDAGCGDMHWLVPVTEKLDLFLGFDVVDEMIVNNRVLYGHLKNHFFNTADICQDVLPRGDAILCRHTLTHLPNDLVLAALRRFKLSDSRYLIATHFPGSDNKDIPPGHWRPMDLTAPPFSLPPALQWIQDGESRLNRFLGIWNMAAW